ncbi:hypothetical protein HWQ17_21305 [Enterobacter pasteurii]|uniref:hypothetical protein n=1 Tax=Enterobacter pasteurii TaxID=3029761 RepID=UPI0011DCE5AC|nr:hypothetical protein [Enterobacter pasteurii]QLA70005.1 hypothetical protein HWQ17_21305 [Enterobacter pasteurii]
MFFLLPAFFENLTFPTSRTISDLLFILIAIILLLFYKKITIEKIGICYILFTALIVLINAANGFANVSDQINTDFYEKLNWLVTDRGISEFVPLGDYYRSTLIYLRYLLIPIYFAVGYRIALVQGRYQALNSLWILLTFALTLNLVYGLFKDNQRISGFFENTATLASLSILCIFLATKLNSYLKITYTLLISGITLLLSQTASAYLGLAAIIILPLLKVKKPHIKSILITVTISIIISTIGLIPSIIEFIGKYLYTGSLINRFTTWGTIISYYDSYKVIMFGLGSFPVFADNLFVWLISGFGLSAIIMYVYLMKLGNYNNDCAIFISMIVWQGLLFPGFIMPYMIITTFMILGILSVDKERGIFCSNTSKRI